MQRPLRPRQPESTAKGRIGLVMHPTFASVGNAVNVTVGLTVGTPEKLLDALQQVAKLVSAARGYHRQTSQVTFFAPVASLAVAIGVSRQTIYNHLPKLKQAGLVAQTGHFCQHNGRVVRDGSLWAVKIRDTPAPAKIDYDFLKGSYRSLGADIASGRTAWNLYSNSPRRNHSVDISCVLPFALPPASESITGYCKDRQAPQLESLMDLPYVPVEGRREAVEASAEAMRVSLGAAKKNINLFRFIVWALLRLEQQKQKSYYYQIFLMVQRCAVDRDENACKNPTGLFISRLKSSGIWTELKNLKQSRIGIRLRT